MPEAIVRDGGVAEEKRTWGVVKVTSLSGCGKEPEMKEMLVNPVVSGQIMQRHSLTRWDGDGIKTDGAVKLAMSTET